MDDAAVINTNEGGFAFTTDSFVVEPIFFPGGDIGRLAVFGTVNDLAAQGADPAWLSLAVVGAEGFSMAELGAIIDSVNSAAVEAGVAVVTGDTKVIERGGLKGLILNTAGLGGLRPGAAISAARVEAGDSLIVSGTIGEHEAAVLCHRYGFGLDSVSSDCGPVTRAAGAVIDKLGEDLKWMRDPTRGGLATVVNELSRQRGAEIEIVETEVPISGPVTDAADILGLDPYYLACEGRLVFVVAPHVAEDALDALRDKGGCPDAREIGRVIRTEADHPLVVLRTELGGRRVLRYLAADQQPRIC
jgi:hydrogenase expression/formation protein HypE